MNFGVNLYNWFLTNAQSLVLMAIVVIGIYLGFKREFSKLIGFLVVSLIAVGLVFNAAGVKDVPHAVQSDHRRIRNGVWMCAIVKTVSRCCAGRVVSQ